MKNCKIVAHVLVGIFLICFSIKALAEITLPAETLKNQAKIDVQIDPSDMEVIKNMELLEDLEIVMPQEDNKKIVEDQRLKGVSHDA